MDKAAALAILASRKQELAKLGISAVWLFGSVARGEATAASDVDVLIDLDGTDNRWKRYLAATELLEGAFACRVDVVMRSALKPWAQGVVQAEAVRAALDDVIAQAIKQAGG